MRLLKLGIYHPSYLRDFYAARLTLGGQTYAHQHQTLIDDCFGSSDFWTSALEKLGYETADLIANAEALQKAWARENDFNFSANDWLFEIATAQIIKFRPDVLLVADYTTFSPEFLRNLRLNCPSLKLILGWCGAPYQNLDVMREWDVALSCVPEIVEDFRAKGLQSYHVNHAFAPRILEKLDLQSQSKIDFAFVGSVVKQSKFHVEREQLLLALVEKTNLQIWSDMKQPSFLQRFSSIFAPAPEIDRRIRRRTNPPVFGLEMFQKLRDSRVVFNNHIDISPKSASNMRLFETTGTGACLLTDWRENLSELFEPDAEVLTYKSAEEGVEKVQYILENESERRQIAEAGQRRTLRDHTFENRAARIDEIIRQFLGRK
jgi:spore maturation protein CgeB